MRKGRLPVKDASPIFSILTSFPQVLVSAVGAGWHCHLDLPGDQNFPLLGGMRLGEFDEGVDGLVAGLIEVPDESHPSTKIFLPPCGEALLHVETPTWLAEDPSVFSLAALNQDQVTAGSSVLANLPAVVVPPVEVRQNFGELFKRFGHVQHFEARHDVLRSEAEPVHLDAVGVAGRAVP